MFFLVESVNNIFWRNQYEKNSSTIKLFIPYVIQKKCLISFFLSIRAKNIFLYSRIEMKLAQYNYVKLNLKHISFLTYFNVGASYRIPQSAIGLTQRLRRLTSFHAASNSNRRYILRHSIFWFIPEILIDSVL